MLAHTVLYQGAHVPVHRYTLAAPSYAKSEGRYVGEVTIPEINKSDCDCVVSYGAAVRPGGVPAAAHLLGCLRVMHAGRSDLGLLQDADRPRVGHSTFVWSGGAR